VTTKKNTPEPVPASSPQVVAAVGPGEVAVPSGQPTDVPQVAVGLPVATDPSPAQVEQTPVPGTFAVAFPLDVFEHGVDGVPPLTRTPINVPSNRAKAVRDAATAAGLTLQEN